MPNRQQLGGKTALRIVGMERAECLHKRVLRQLFRPGLVPDDPGDDAEDGPLISEHEFAKRGLRPFEGSANQLSVGGSHSPPSSTKESRQGLQIWQGAVQASRALVLLMAAARRPALAPSRL